MLKQFIKDTPFGISILLLALAVGFIVLISPIGGNRALIVRGGSMQPAIETGDLIIAKTGNNYKIGDIIAFKQSPNSKSAVTHRIVGIQYQDEKIFYRTKGDTNQNTDAALVPEGSVIGRANYAIRGAGKLFAFTKSRTGLVSAVIVPALLVIIAESINIYRELKKRKTGPGRLYYSGPMGLAIILAVILAPPLRFTHAFFTDSALSTNNVFAAAATFPAAVPDFPSCPEGAGTVKEFYAEGWHWVLGIEGNQFGADKVFDIGDNNFVQCYFPTTGTEGIQTNWFAAVNLTQDQINGLVADGWTYITDGFAWSLPVQLYLARNLPFTFFSPPSANPPSSSSPGPGSIVINEVMWMGSSTSTADEWIELKNMTSNPIDIGDWKIENAAQAGGTISIPPGSSIPSNGFFLIANYDSSNSSSALNISADFVTTSVSLKTSANGHLILKDGSDNVIDRAKGDSWPAGVNGPPNWHSMERNSPPGDGLDAGNWHTCIAAICNSGAFWKTADGQNHGTPKTPNSPQG